MNEQNLRERSDASDAVEQIDPVTDTPAADSHDFLAALIQQTPLGTGVVAPELVDETLPHNTQQVEASVDEVISTPNITAVDTLLEHAESEHFRTRWKEIQGKFVDEPRSAVQQADTLVSEVIDTITEMFANEHGALEGQWKDGKDVSTEDLRQALQHYRSFFNRLVV
jgi:hypothetical protein